jgi:alkanesulfonate monooxygenase SsuD/methylene tetrahydromethanopterin reductase-like flavin-dependent oxidoreductase (luciferase family)
MVDLYRNSAPQGAPGLRVALAAHTHVGETSQSAREVFYPHYVNYWHQSSGGRVPRISRDQFDHATGSGSVLMVGSVDEITDRLLFAHEVLGIDRFLAQMDVGHLPFGEVAAVIERLATRVAPAVRKTTQVAAVG